jgi:hypothetical protein
MNSLPDDAALEDSILTNETETATKCCIVFGDRGSGTSTLCNLLMGDSAPFPINEVMALQVKTTKIQIEEYNKLKIVDFPAFQHFEEDDDILSLRLDELDKRLEGKEINAFVVVVNNTLPFLHSGTTKTIDRFLAHFDPNYFWPRCCFFVVKPAKNVQILAETVR